MPLKDTKDLYRPTTLSPKGQRWWRLVRFGYSLGIISKDAAEGKETLAIRKGKFIVLAFFVLLIIYMFWVATSQS